MRGAELGSVVCASEVDGTAEFRGSGGVLQIGGSDSQPDCGANVFGDDLILRSKSTTEGTYVSNAIVRRDLVCSGNDPAPVGIDNRIRGEATGQCADLPAPSTHRMGTHGRPDRTTATEARLQERSDRAREQAERLGTAVIG